MSIVWEYDVKTNETKTFDKNLPIFPKQIEAKSSSDYKTEWQNATTIDKKIEIIAKRIGLE